MNWHTRLLLGGDSGGHRPAPIDGWPVLPFDPSSGGNTVHTTFPPEQVVPPPMTDPSFLVTDFTGCQLEGDYTPTQTAAIIANGGVTMTSGRWRGLSVPFLPDANTTPPTMLMTLMLMMYPSKVRDAHLTELALRRYDDFIYASEGWSLETAGLPSIAQMLDWVAYVKSWGFRPVYWRGNARTGADRMFQTLADAGAISFYVHGKEVDSYMGAQEYEDSIQAMDRYIGRRFPMGAHFTADYERGLGYPIGAPREYFIPDWAPYNGWLHLCQQLDVTADAGLQGAGMYYGRQHVNCGQGPAAPPGAKGAPNSRVIAFETMATAKLYGMCSEAYGALRSYELMCGTRNDPRARAVSGTADGGWLFQSGRHL